MNYTVHGDAVNLAARLEQLNKQHGTLVLISESTAALLNGEHPIEPLGEVEIRGKTQSVRIFSLRADL
jgi:adenylate cyclase